MAIMGYSTFSMHLYYSQMSIQLGFEALTIDNPKSQNVTIPPTYVFLWYNT